MMLPVYRRNETEKNYLYAAFNQDHVVLNNLRFNFRIGWDFYMVLQLSWLHDALDISYIF